jgi:hypothetical protein
MAASCLEVVFVSRLESWPFVAALGGAISLAV